MFNQCQTHTQTHTQTRSASHSHRPNDDRFTLAQLMMSLFSMFITIVIAFNCLDWSNYLNEIEIFCKNRLFFQVKSMNFRIWLNNLLEIAKNSSGFTKKKLTSKWNIFRSDPSSKHLIFYLFSQIKISVWNAKIEKKNHVNRPDVVSTFRKGSSHSNGRINQFFSSKTTIITEASNQKKKNHSLDSNCDYLFALPFLFISILLVCYFGF